MAGSWIPRVFDRLRTGQTLRQLVWRTKDDDGQLVAARAALPVMLLVVTYFFVVIGLVRVLAVRLGWSANLLLLGIGALHVVAVLIAVYGSVASGDANDQSSSQASQASESANERLERADTLIMRRRSAGTRSSSRSAGQAP